MRSHSIIKVLVSVFATTFLLYLTNGYYNFQFENKVWDKYRVLKSVTPLYEYTWNNTKGRPFHPDPWALASIGFPLTSSFVTLSASTLEDFVFTAAVDQRFASRCLEALATIQEHFPNKKIILYDLGLSTASIIMFKAVCNVELRRFPFSSFPSHVRANLYNYSWKILAIHAVLQEYSGVFWVDSSIRFLNNQTEQAFSKVYETGGITLFVDAGHSNYAVTMKETLAFLPTDSDRQKTTIQSGATAMLIYRTQEVYEHLIQWSVLCSLEEECINRGRVKCDFHGNDRWAQCSRFDQVIINILCSNHLGFNRKRYTTTLKLFDVLRRSMYHKQPRYCEPYSERLLHAQNIL